jgi:hypothetical protein
MRWKPFLLLAVLATSTFAPGCGAPPADPTAEQYLASAKESLRGQDFDNAVKNLDRMIRAAGNQPLAQQGALLRTVLLTALAEGDLRMGQAYAAGALQLQGQSGQSAFVRMRTDYYGMSRAHITSAMEAILAQRVNIQMAPIPLDVALPPVRQVDPAPLSQLELGRTISEPDRLTAETECSRNAWARRLASVAGAGALSGQERASISAPGIQIDPRMYLLEMSDEFLRLSIVFGPGALDDARYLRATQELILGNLRVVEALLETHPDAAIRARMDKMKADCELRLQSLSKPK